MTKKEIIIDKVNVNECKDFFENECFNGEKFRWCKDNKDCYFKQLKRKEEECERLSSLIRETKIYSNVCCECRDEILTYSTICGRTNYTQIEIEERSLKKIIQQLDQLKAENEKYRELATSFEADFFNALSDKENAYLKLLIKALREIKEIAKQNVGYFPNGEIFARPEIEKILQKCEVVD